MKKLIVSLVLAILCSAAIAIAANQVFVPADVMPSNGHASVKIPVHAVEVAPHVFRISNATYNGTPVEGYIFVHYKKGFAKPGSLCGNGICDVGENAAKCPSDCSSSEPDTSSCYEFMARGAKWKSVEPYLISTLNMSIMNSSYVPSVFEASISKWESAAGRQILGYGNVTNIQLEADTVSPDGFNEAYFGSIDEPGAIAITIVWGYFNVPPKSRELIEWDQVYDSADFEWSLFGEPGKMDFESIATHELGHSAGMADLYTSECAEQTMYGYASEGETKKRTLESGDIRGIQELYS